MSHGKENSEEVVLSAEVSAETSNTETSPDSDECVRLQTELTEIKDQLLRALAEMENVRRRAVREREEASKFAITQFARDILSIGDNLKRALSTAPEDREELDAMLQQFISGVEMTQREFTNILARFNVTEISPLNEAFDPAFHQAMFEVETLEQPGGTVVQVMQNGYKLQDRLLRPALVGVAKTPK